MHLAIEQLTLRHGALEVVRGLTGTVAPPARIWVGGVARSGKSTLLKALAGLHPAAEGCVRWDGRDVAALTRSERRDEQARLGMVFQSDALFDGRTALENVLVPLLRRGHPPEAARARAEEVLARVGLGEAAGQLPDTLSGGMRKRVGIARALAADPEILLADDPLAGLDPGTARRVLGLLCGMMEGRTLIVASPVPLPALEPTDSWHLPTPRLHAVGVGGP